MRGTDYRLLLVEDDVNLADAIATKLSNAGFTMMKVTTGSSGLKLATTREIDLLMLDLNLPDISGEKVLEIVRARSNVPVLIISCKKDENARINGFHTGADGYMTKPLSLKELEAQVRAILRRSTVASLGQACCDNTRDSHTMLRCNGVELILHRDEAYVDGEPIELGPIEFQILRYFMEHAGSTVSAQQLVAAVWGHGYDRHIVETNVHRLRQKIEEDPKKPQRLVTVRGYGYMYEMGDEARQDDAVSEEVSLQDLAMS